jgi:hypothetical protein
MSRRGAAAKVRDRRHRAAVALRSQTSERSAADGRSSTSASENDHAGQGPEPVAADRSASNPQTSAPPLKARPRRIPRRGADFDLDPLRQLVVGRDAAARAVDVEVRRLRRSGAGWPEIAEVLGVSRQGARQKYRTRNQLDAGSNR